MSSSRWGSPGCPRLSVAHPSLSCNPERRILPHRGRRWPSFRISKCWKCIALYYVQKMIFAFHWLSCSLQEELGVICLQLGINRDCSISEEWPFHTPCTPVSVVAEWRLNNDRVSKLFLTFDCFCWGKMCWSGRSRLCSWWCPWRSGSCRTQTDRPRGLCPGSPRSGGPGPRRAPRWSGRRTRRGSGGGQHTQPRPEHTSATWWRRSLEVTRYKCSHVCGSLGHILPEDNSLDQSDPSKG